MTWIVFIFSRRIIANVPHANSGHCRPDGITITCDAHDVIAILPLESGGNNLHVLLVAEGELQR